MTTAIELAVGLETWRIHVDDAGLLPLTRQEPPQGQSRSPRELLREALEHPLELNVPLRRALTPDDRVVLVVDEQLPSLAELVTELVEHLQSAGVKPAAITVLVPPEGGRGQWLADLPDEIGDIRVETHDPEDPPRFAYLATSAAGRRVYLNRTLVDADFIIVLTGRGYDPSCGYRGAANSLFPVFSNGETRASFVGQFQARTLTRYPAMAKEAEEISWLIGMPFLIQVIEGVSDQIEEIVAGLPDCADEGIRRQDARWRATVASRAETVIAAVSGDPQRIDFAALAWAVATAARVVQPDGRIVLLTTAAPELAEGAEILRQAEDPAAAERMMRKRKPDDWPASSLWTFAAKQARLMVAAGWPDDLIEDLFATPLRHVAELQRLIDAADSLLILQDAHKLMVDLAS
jgi:nickel-dependent lactate racemase